MNIIHMPNVVLTFLVEEVFRIFPRQSNMPWNFAKKFNNMGKMIWRKKTNLVIYLKEIVYKNKQIGVVPSSLE